MRQPLIVLALLTFPSLSACTGRAPPMSVPGPEGCYRFESPLGDSATGERERGDSTWYVVELRPGGAVARPLFARAEERARWARRSSWRSAGDTLFVRVFDGLVGWDVTLRRRGTAYAGVAQYLSDARAVGGQPPRAQVRAGRAVCPSPPA